MKTKQLTISLAIIGLVALGTTEGRAQTETVAPANGAAEQVGSAENSPYLFTIDAPYAFRFHRLGVSAEITKMVMPNNYLGIEVSHWDALPHGYTLATPGGMYGADSARINYRQNITTANIVDRYYIPLTVLGDPSDPTPVQIYLGASAGAGWVSNSIIGQFPVGYSYDASHGSSFSGELLAGVQWAVSTTVSFRAGYRFIYISNVTEPSYATAPVDSGALEAGLSFRF
ncbi:MAG: outer membrane protein [Opitutaceae bacterium]